MFKEDQLDKGKKRKGAWQRELSSQLSLMPERKKRFSTVSDLEIKDLYTPEDLSEMDFEKDISFPCSYPFTRGVQPSMYRGRLWTMRMFAGLGSAEDTK